MAKFTVQGRRAQNAAQELHASTWTSLDLDFSGKVGENLCASKINVHSFFNSYTGTSQGGRWDRISKIPLGAVLIGYSNGKESGTRAFGHLGRPLAPS